MLLESVPPADIVVCSHYRSACELSSCEQGDCGRKGPGLAKSPAAQTEARMLKKWRWQWRCCTAPWWNSRNCRSPAEIRLLKRLYLFSIIEFHTQSWWSSPLVLAARWFSSFDVNESGVVASTHCKTLNPGTLMLPSCATVCILKSESHQMVHRVRVPHHIYPQQKENHQKNKHLDNNFNLATDPQVNKGWLCLWLQTTGRPFISGNLKIGS